MELNILKFVGVNEQCVINVHLENFVETKSCLEVALLQFTDVGNFKSGQ